MRIFYVFTLVFMLAGYLTQAQTTYYWVGGDTYGLAWEDAANWSLSSGGSGGAGYPGTNSADIAIIDQDANIFIGIVNITVGSVQVVNNSNVLIYYNYADNVGTMVYTNTTGLAYLIEEGSTRKDSTAGTDQLVHLVFQTGTQGLIDGTLIVDSKEFVKGVQFPSSAIILDFPNTTGLSNRIDVNGTIYYTWRAAVWSDDYVFEPYIKFNEGSLLHMDTNGQLILIAEYHPNSTVYLTGNINHGSSHNPGNDDFGNLIYESAIQETQINLGFQQTTFWGDVEIRNSNGFPVILCGNFGFGIRNVFIKGDLTITGNTNFVVSRTGATNTVTLDVEGDIHAGGIGFDLDNHLTDVNASTTLIARGNIYHTSGIFGYSTNYSNNVRDNFVLEMAGSSPQTISSVTGVWLGINNITGFTLRINNPAGVTLNTPLMTGRLHFITGVLHTSATNMLSLRHNSAIASQRTVLGESDNAYVDGPMRRRSSSINTFHFPIGKNGKLKRAYVVTTSATDSYYQAEYFPESYSDVSVVHPLLAVAPEYWDVQTVSGSNFGSVGLDINGGVPGALTHHGIVAALYNGTDWERAGGEMIAPGTVTTGEAYTGELPSLTGLYTLAYGNQSALPVILTGFNARKINSGTAAITWQVTRESTPAKFDVLKSTNGKDFEPIATVNGVFRQENYQATDTRLGTGTTYYRLKMHDIDGTVSLSKIIAVVNSAEGIMLTSIMPSVVTNNARLNISSANRHTMMLVITDMHGRMVHRQVEGIIAGNQEVFLNLGKLSKGSYQITGYYNGGKTGVIRFIKQ